MTPLHNPAVAAVFNTYPPAARRRLMVLREAIFTVAAQTPGVGPLEETLKWGEPAYLTTQTGAGSTVRLGWKKARPQEYALYFICTTTLVDTFRTLFPHDFAYDGNRAIVFQQDDVVPMDALAWCLAAALTYRLRRKSQAAAGA